MAYLIHDRRVFGLDAADLVFMVSGIALGAVILFLGTSLWCTPQCIELGNSAIAMVLTAHIAGQFTPSATPNCPFAIARARIAKIVTGK